MAAVVQAVKIRSSTSGSITQGSAITVTAGNLLVVGTSEWNETTAESVSDNLNGTYTRTGQCLGAGGTTFTGGLHYAKNITGGSLNLTITGGSGGAACEGFWHEVSGCDPTTPFTTGQFAHTDNMVATTNPVTPALTNTQASGVFFAYLQDAATGGTETMTVNSTGSSPTGWALKDTVNSQETDGNNFIPASMPFLIVSSSAASKHGWTVTTSGTHGALIAFFNAASSGTTPSSSDSATLTDTANKIGVNGPSDSASQTDTTKIGTSSSDAAATLAEQSAIALLHSDTAAFAEQVALALATSDAAGVSEQTSSSAQTSTADSATLSAQTSINVGASDTATQGDSTSSSAAAGTSDSATLTDSTSVNQGGTSKSDSDTATLAEQVRIALQDVDSAHLGEQMAIALAHQDTVTLGELVSVAIAIADAANLSEGQSVTVQTSSSDSATLADSGSVTQQGSSPSSSDAGTLADTASTTAGTSASDIGQLAEQAAIALKATDVVAMTEQIGLGLIAADNPKLAEQLQVATANAVADPAALGELQTIVAAIQAIADAAALHESASIVAQGPAGAPIRILIARARPFILVARVRPTTLIARS